MTDHQPADRPRPARPRRAERQDRSADWDQLTAFGPDADSELPPWAGPSVYATRPGGTRLRPPAPADDYESVEHADPWEGDEPPAWPDDEPAPASAPQPAGTGRAARRGRSGGTGQSGRPDGEPRPRRLAGRRAAAARLRKSRRRVLRWCGIAIVLCVAGAAVAVVVTHKNVQQLPYVTSLQKGEFTSVPDACTALSPATLSQYLPGTRSTVQSENSAISSQCSFTVDRKPTFLLLSVAAQSYQPFPAATGDGSATQNAIDNFATARALLAQPPKHSPLPKASITKLTGLGKSAFLAVQIGHTGGIARDILTISVLDRNLIITVSMVAQESGGYGPVALGTLQADAQAVTSAMLRKALAGPTA